MRFRPCIDIHNGKVRQIVGGSLQDEGDEAKVNFTSELSASDYARIYRQDGLKGGHVILLNPATSEYFEETRTQAIQALWEYPGGMQLGGGITPENAGEYLDAGASHVIVTSYVFQKGQLLWKNLERMKNAVGKERLVLDLSCREKDGVYRIVTDRWQRFTEVRLESSLLDRMSQYCDEFLIHGVDVEGKAAGVEEELVRMLGSWRGIPITYAGGIGTEEDLKRFETLSGGRLDFTIGSALDLFGGCISYKDICRRK